MFCPMKFCSDAKANTDGIKPSPRDIRLGVWGAYECTYRHMYTYNAYNTIYIYMYRLQLVPVSKDGIEKIYS